MIEGEELISPPEAEKVFERGKEVYLDLRKEGLNLIAPRAAEDSLSPEAPRTLMDLLGESAHRARNLIREIKEENLPKTERELEFIKLTWEGFEDAARESGDEEIAIFIRDVFINSVFKPSSEEASLEI